MAAVIEAPKFWGQGTLIGWIVSGLLASLEFVLTNKGTVRITLGMSTTSIPRSLADGWDFSPSWRNQVIEATLSRILLAEDSDRVLEEVLFSEDPYVRQGVRFRLHGTCANTSAFAWAYGAIHSKFGVGAIVKAMAVADVSVEQIAMKLGTHRGNVSAFLRLFFDIRSAAGNRIWLHTLTHRDELATSVEAVRERLYLTVALDHGATGLDRMLNRELDSGHMNLDDTAKQIEAIAARRALDYVRHLDAVSAAPSEKDLHHYTTIRSMRSREAISPTSSDQGTGMNWELHQVLMEAMHRKQNAEIEAANNAPKPSVTWEQVQEDHRRREAGKAA